MPYRGVIWVVFVTAAWGAVMLELFRRDLSWDVGEVPQSGEKVRPGYEENFILYSERSGGVQTKLGTAVARHQYDSIERRRVVDSELTLDKVPGFAAGRLRLKNQIRRKEDGGIEGFETEMSIRMGAARSETYEVKISGNVAGGHCLATVELKGFPRKTSYRFPLDASAAEVAQEYQTFSRMPGLKVGQSWKVKMISFQGLLLTAVARAALPGKADDNEDKVVNLTQTPFEDCIAQVIDQETIRWNGEDRKVLVVRLRTGRSGGQTLKSYVDMERDGEVLRQVLEGVGERLVFERVPDAGEPPVRQ